MGTHFRDQDGYTQILEVTPGLRHRIEAAIDNLVQLLDSIDPDADFEPDNDNEPQGDEEDSLGWTDREAQKGRYSWTGQGGDLEHEHDGREPQEDDEDGADDEPSIGVSFYAGYGVTEVDLELDDADREPDVDDEEGHQDHPFELEEVNLIAGAMPW